MTVIDLLETKIVDDFSDFLFLLRIIYNFID